MDIIVTTPKKEIENSNEEGKWAEKNGGHWFRVFHFKPDINIGDRIYFVMNGFIVGYGILMHSPYQTIDGETCDVTERVWGKDGDWVLEYNDWHWLDNQIEFKGFEGIRYVFKLPEEMRNRIIGEVSDSRYKEKGK